MNTFQKDNAYLAHTYNRFPLEIVSGHGAVAVDSNGKSYIDMTSGIAVNSFGLTDEIWINAVSEQLKKFQHTSNLFYTSPPVLLAELICQKTKMSKVFFVNSGAEANECAIKLARAHGAKNLGKENYNIITLKNSFHGRTITTLSATGQDVFHQKFTPMTLGFLYASANDLKSVEKLVKENACCAVMIETIQGEGGVNELKAEFVEGVSKICKSENLLLIIDEVQTGNGRTGELYSYMNYGIEPDIFTTAKGLGGGLPIGACVMGKKAENLFAPGDNGTTFGANPAICAGALSIMQRLDDDFLHSVKQKGEYLKSKLLALKNVESVSGRGLMLGVKLKNISSTDAICKARDMGLLLLSAKDKIRLLPPLIISKEEIDKAIEIIAKI